MSEPIEICEVCMETGDDVYWDGERHICEQCAALEELGLDPNTPLDDRTKALLKHRFNAGGKPPFPYRDV